MLQAAPKVHRHDFTEQQEQQASVISVSSGTRRRRTKQATPSTSSSGGVLLPRYFTDVGLAKTQACRLESTFEEIDSLIESEEAREHHPVDNQLYRSLEEAISRSYADGFGEQAGEDNAETTTEMLRYSRLKVWAWYIHNGGALVVFAASLLTALLLIIVGQTGIGPAFTAAGWVLAGGTLLTLTVKTCVEERPKRNEDAEEMALRPLRRDGRRPL
ncbi:hypothetical protein MMC13_000056 [Lambiella insularis]|nr:hypothetical protein [Lambiella insularis]